MKFLLAFVAAICIGFQPLRAASASDAFAGAGAISSDWTVADGGLSISSDNLVGSDNDYNWAWWDAITWADNQWSELVVGTYGLDGYCVLLVRAGGAEATRDGYLYTFTQTGGGNADVFRVVDGVATKIVNLAESYGVASPGDVVRMTVSGQNTSTLISVSINGAEIFNYTDNNAAAINSGSPGVGTFRSAAGVASWQAGDDAGGGGSTPTSGRASLLGVGM